MRQGISGPQTHKEHHEFMYSYIQLLPSQSKFYLIDGKQFCVKTLLFIEASIDLSHMGGV